MYYVFPGPKLLFRHQADMNNISEGFSMPESEFLRRIISYGQSSQNIKCVARGVNICVSRGWCSNVYIWR